jgi:hypothetical protein
MKKYMLLVLFFFFNSCQLQVSNSLILNDTEWYDALELALTFTGTEHGDVNIFDHFGNRELAEIISYEYTFGSKDHGYQINDSILHLLATRDNGLIVNRLDTMLGIRFISDTIDFPKDYLLLSQPFVIDESLLCYSITQRKVDSSKDHHWIFYISKQGGAIKTKAIYDVTGDRYYESEVH